MSNNYVFCCCGDPCLTSLCGLNDIANNGSIRVLTVPPLFDSAVSFTLSVANPTPADFGCVSLTPYNITPYFHSTCKPYPYDCCCDYQVLGECVAGGTCCYNSFPTEYGDYQIHPTNWDTMATPCSPCEQASLAIGEVNSVLGSNLAQLTWSGDFTYPWYCQDGIGQRNGCNDENYCTNPPWVANHFQLDCVAVLNIDGSSSVPPLTNYAVVSATLYAVKPIDIDFYPPPCDCKCPYMEMTIIVSGSIYYSITDVYHQPPDPVSYGVLPASATVLTYRKRLVRAKALNYYTYYDWINDTSEPFQLFMIRSGELGVHVFYNQNGVDGTMWSCTPGPCPNCIAGEGTVGTYPTSYIESYNLCSSATSETSNPPVLSSASCIVYPNTIQLAISANYPPVVTSISPSSGTIAGGTVVTVTGTKLWGCHEVVVGGNLSPNFYINTNNSINFAFVTPAHVAGVVTVVFTWSWGTTTTNFTYV